jgi:hypothetical protein
MPHNHRSRATTPSQDLHIRLLHLQDCLRPATQTANDTEEYFCLWTLNQEIVIHFRIITLLLSKTVHRHSLDSRILFLCTCKYIKCNKALLWGITHSDWPPIVCPRPFMWNIIYLFQLNDFHIWTVTQSNPWNCCMLHNFLFSIDTVLVDIKSNVICHIRRIQQV